jgi:hypothetical protein
MKLGTENKRTTIIAVVLGLLAVLAFARMITSFSGGSSTPTPALGNNAAAVNAAANAAGQSSAPAARPATRQRRTQRNDKRVAGATFTQSLDPRLNLALLEQSEKITYTGTGRNIFKMEEEPKIETPAASPMIAAQQQQKLPRWVPQGPAPPPGIPLKFYGWASKPGETRSVFLSSGGGDIFVAREGEIIDRRYKIVSIQPNTVEVEDMLTNNKQRLPLTQG